MSRSKHISPKTGLIIGRGPAKKVGPDGKDTFGRRELDGHGQLTAAHAVCSCVPAADKDATHPNEICLAAGYLKPWKNLFDDLLWQGYIHELADGRVYWTGRDFHQQGHLRSGRPVGRNWKSTLTPAPNTPQTSGRVQAPTPKTQEASDVSQPPQRACVTTYRILRDTDLARRVKTMHEHKCQFKSCGHTIQLPDGTFYAEAHHIQALGSPHHGPDVVGNILCLCPNHHAELDYGVIAISLSALRCCDGHAIDQKYVDYHNRHIHKRP